MPYIFGISGRKNTGKTKIVCEIVKELSERGYDVATIKHDGHEFEPDRPGTDTFRHLNAGAFGTAIFSAISGSRCDSHRGNEAGDTSEV